MKWHFASVLPRVEFGFPAGRPGRTCAGCVASPDTEFLVELPLDGGTVQEVRLWNSHWTLVPGWTIPRSGEEGSLHPGVAGRTSWNKTRSAQSPPQRGCPGRRCCTGVCAPPAAGGSRTSTKPAGEKHRQQEQRRNRTVISSATQTTENSSRIRLFSASDIS